MSIRQHDFTIERRFRQTPAQAFRAFADPELKRRWFGVPEGWTDTRWELDFRVGGSELSVGRDPRGTLHEFRSRYHDIVDGERIVFAYDLLLDGRLISVSLTTVEVRPDGDGTRARLHRARRVLRPTLTDPRGALARHRPRRLDELRLACLGGAVTGSPHPFLGRSSRSSRFVTPGQRRARARRAHADGVRNRGPRVGTANEADETAAGWLMRPRGAYVMGRISGRSVSGRRTGAAGASRRTCGRLTLRHVSAMPFEMEGGTTFHFVTDGFDAAYAQARETAGDDGVDIAGGASTVRQALIAGVVDELTLDIAPVLLGSGERIFDGVGSLGFEPVEVLHSPLATHIRYRRAS